jgi:DNA-binding HxlR family transcriptional regulator
MGKKVKHGLFAYSWSIPVLGEICNQGGARFVMLLNRLGLSRSVLSSTLGRLMEDHLIKLNPGYGHPLRPEYILTGSGKRIAFFCSELFHLVTRQESARHIHSRWSFPILFTISDGAVRFSKLKQRLGPITSRALSEELKQLIEEGYIQRRIGDDYPPTTSYALTDRSRPYLSLYSRHRDQIAGFW